MLSWLRHRTHRLPSDDELLNAGPGLASNWGETLLSPIKGRLGERHPHLDAGQLDALEDAAKTGGHARDD